MHFMTVSEIHDHIFSSSQMDTRVKSSSNVELGELGHLCELGR